MDHKITFEGSLWSFLGNIQKLLLSVSYPYPLYAALRSIKHFQIIVLLIEHLQNSLLEHYKSRHVYYWTRHYILQSCANFTVLSGTLPLQLNSGRDRYGIMTAMPHHVSALQTKQSQNVICLKLHNSFLLIKI